MRHSDMLPHAGRSARVDAGLSEGTDCDSGNNPNNPNDATARHPRVLSGWHAA
ncbi:MAG: hypothetical protein WBG86_17070 [Polyangiales bacterium]